MANLTLQKHQSHFFATTSSKASRRLHHFPCPHATAADTDSLAASHVSRDGNVHLQCSLGHNSKSIAATAGLALQAEPKVLQLPPDLQGHITYQVVDSIDSEDVSELLAKVDWPARQRSKLETALQNSYMLATLVSHHPQHSPALVGMARVVSDGAFNAQLWDVIVDPDFQGVGLGKQLVSEVVKTLLKEDICNIVTFAEKSGTKFYEKIGFQSDPDNVKGMFYRKMM